MRALPWPRRRWVEVKELLKKFFFCGVLIWMGPGGGASELPSTMEAKMNSAIRAKIRTQAEKNGYAIDVIEAMVDKRLEQARHVRRLKIHTAT